VLSRLRSRLSLLGGLPLLLFLGQLLGALLRLEAVDLHPLRIDDVLFLRGVLGRDAIAVVGDALVVDPFVQGAFAAVGSGGGA
jgi:hypothetical protein